MSMDSTLVHAEEMERADVYVLGRQYHGSRRVVSIPSALYWNVSEMVASYLSHRALGLPWVVPKFPLPPEQTEG